MGELHYHFIDNCRAPNHPMDGRCLCVACKSSCMLWRSSSLFLSAVSTPLTRWSMDMLERISGWTAVYEKECLAGCASMAGCHKECLTWESRDKAL